MLEQILSTVQEHPLPLPVHIDNAKQIKLIELYYIISQLHTITFYNIPEKLH